MNEQELAAEVARLRAENERLHAENAVRHDHLKAEMNQALRQVAQHGAREDAHYRAIQAGGLHIGGGQLTSLEHEAAGLLLKDWGIL